MNGQFFYDRSNASDDSEASENDPNNPVVDPEPLDENIPADTDLNIDTPVEETVIMVEPMDEPVTDEVSNADPLAREILTYETADKLDMAEETLPYQTPADEVIVDETVLSSSIYDNPPTIEPVTPVVPIVSTSLDSATLLGMEDSEQLRARWSEIQAKFVDEPREAVQEADALVSEVVDKITQIFTSEHASLEGQWKQGNDVSTEDLRKALQHYRSFFKRLVV